MRHFILNDIGYILVVWNGEYPLKNYCDCAFWEVDDSRIKHAEWEGVNIRGFTYGYYFRKTTELLKILESSYILLV